MGKVSGAVGVGQEAAAATAEPVALAARLAQVVGILVPGGKAVDGAGADAALVGLPAGLMAEGLAEALPEAASTVGVAAAAAAAAGLAVARVGKVVALVAARAGRLGPEQGR